MSAAPAEPAFFVSAYADPVVIRIQGRASYLNAAPLGDFLARMQKQGRRDFVIDTQGCTGMDSTFLGLLAGLALEVRTAQPAGSVVLCRLSPRNLELVRNLGLHRLLEVDASASQLAFGASGTNEALSGTKSESEIESAKRILRAHECLCVADDSNKAKFQDVLAFLRHQVDGNGSGGRPG